MSSTEARPRSRVFDSESGAFDAPRVDLDRPTPVVEPELALFDPEVSDRHRKPVRCHGGDLEEVAETVSRRMAASAERGA